MHETRDASYPRIELGADLGQKVSYLLVEPLVEGVGVLVDEHPEVVQHIMHALGGVPDAGQLVDCCGDDGCPG